MPMWELARSFSAIRLCDGSDQREVDELHAWFDSVGEPDWEGDESGVTIHSGEESVRAEPGEWILCIFPMGDSGAVLPVAADSDPACTPS